MLPPHYNEYMLLPVLISSAFLISGENLNSPPPQQNNNLSRYIYPLCKALKCPEVIVDTKDSPGSAKWAAQAKKVVEVWYPKITELLSTDGKDPLTGIQGKFTYKAPKQIRLVFKADLEVPAYASNDTITISGKWIAAHPEDFGMVVHELTHVVQSYPQSENTPWWLVEGVADYIRWWRYEPELHAGPGQTKIDKTKSKYTDGYRTTAMWLAWTARKYNMALVPCLDKAMRESTNPSIVFTRLTGKNEAELWAEFVAEQ